MSCQYGCPRENIEAKCVNCGHPKKNHSAIHPHHCEGEYDKQGVHVVKSCLCNAFKSVKEDANPYEFRASLPTSKN